MTNVIFTATSRACQLSTHISFFWFCAKIRTWWHLLGLLFIKREFTFELDIWQFFSTQYTQTKERLNILSCYHLLVVTTVNPKIKWYTYRGIIIVKIWIFFSCPTLCLSFSELSFSAFASLRNSVLAELVFSSKELSFSPLQNSKQKTWSLVLGGKNQKKSNSRSEQFKKQNTNSL